MPKKPSYKQLEQKIADLEKRVLKHVRAKKKRKDAEKALRESEARFRDFVENAPVGMYAIDMQGNFTYGNKKLREITGHKLKDWLNKPFAPMVHPDDLEIIMNRIQDGINGKKTLQPFEIRSFDISGNIMWLEIMSETIRQTNKKGKEELMGFQSFVWDITRRKKAEEEKKKLESQLILAQKMEAIGTLAGGIAHDFNNILYPIIGYAEMISEDVSKDSIIKQNLDEILTAAIRARDLVRQILTFSRHTEEKQTPINLQPVIEDVLKLIRASLPSTIEIKRRISKKCGVALADSGQIHQVVMNLCTNAYHAMRENGGTLQLSLTETNLKPEDMNPASVLEPGRYARLTVSDTGTGISPEVANKIFDPYFTTKVTGEGTGLGLAVAHAIIIKHNGEIRVKNRPGAGTTFEVFLPVVTKNITKKLSCAGPVPFGDESILLVEDEAQTLNMSSKMLSRLGYTVDARINSADALKTFKANPSGFDLVITDMTMPYMTGDVLSKKILKIRPDIPIILCTGFSELISAEDAKKIGIAAYVMKPITSKEIGKIIRNLLDKSAKKKDFLDS